MCLTAGQIQWTADVTKALGITKERGDKKALKTMKKKQVRHGPCTNQTLLTILFTFCLSLSYLILSYLIVSYVVIDQDDE